MGLVVAIGAALLMLAWTLASWAVVQGHLDIVTIEVAANVRLIDVMRAIDDAGIDLIDVNRRQATLDDVFLTLTSKQEVLA